MPDCTHGLPAGCSECDADPCTNILTRSLRIVAELRANPTPRSQEDEATLLSFTAQLDAAGTDVMQIVDLLAEAALMTRQARGNHCYRVPRSAITGAEMVAACCLDAARLAFEGVRLHG